MHKPCLGAKQDIKSFCNHVCTPRRAPQIDGQEKLTGKGGGKQVPVVSTVSKEFELYQSGWRFLEMIGIPKSS
jgi:hypothetical protein